MNHLKIYLQKIQSYKLQSLHKSRYPQPNSQNNHNSFMPCRSKLTFQKQLQFKKSHQTLQKLQKNKISKSLQFIPDKKLLHKSKLQIIQNLRSHQQKFQARSNFLNKSLQKPKFNYLKFMLKRSSKYRLTKQENSMKKLNKKKSQSIIDQKKQYHNKKITSLLSNKNDDNIEGTIEKYQTLKIPFVLNYSYKSRQGSLLSNIFDADSISVNQDSILIKTLNKNINLFAVADGHGKSGHLISQYAVKSLPNILQNNLKSVSPEKAFILTYLKLQQLIFQSQINSQSSGTTLICVLIQYNQLICANVGDSRAILVRKGIEKCWQIVQLSQDHKPSLIKEKSRILKSGGKIQPFFDQNGMAIGPLRVWLPNNKMQGLSISRSLGDNMSKSIGIISQPQIFKITLSQKDKFIILASDGVWQFLSNEDIVRLVIPLYNENLIQQVCDRIIKVSYDRWTKEDNNIVDDITLIVIFLSSGKKQNIQNVKMIIDY